MFIILVINYLKTPSRLDYVVKFLSRKKLSKELLNAAIIHHPFYNYILLQDSAALTQII